MALTVMSTDNLSTQQDNRVMYNPSEAHGWRCIPLRGWILTAGISLYTSQLFTVVLFLHHPLHTSTSLVYLQYDLRHQVVHNAILASWYPTYHDCCPPLSREGTCEIRGNKDLLDPRFSLREPARQSIFRSPI
jgi:hypothetical protein